VPDWNAIDPIARGRRIQVDSRKVEPGDVFLAFQGEYADGRDFIPDAVAKRAGAVLWEAEDFQWSNAWQTANLPVPQLRAQAGIIASHLLGHPSQAMWTVGVTGTNGKTSITHWLAQAFTALGHKGAVLGTVGNGFPGALASSTHTTLDPVTLQGWLSSLQKEGASHVAMEVSSHGLAQARAHGVAFRAAVFTNLTQDHLDYHGSMAEYAATKQKLFEWEGLEHAIINADDAFGRELIASTTASKVWSFGFEHGDIRCVSLKAGLDGMRLQIATPQGEAVLNTALIGRFNASNLLASLGVLLASGVALADAVAALEKIEAAPGRMQRLGGNGLPLVVVDYAHTPDALEKALETLRETVPEGGRLFCVFGCGGNRDRTKRALMGEIACRLADNVLITNDNPRNEEPKSIIEDIVAGVFGVPGTGEANYTIDCDRAHAIEDAIDLASGLDVVLIAGKGHETYQEIKGIRAHFDDVEEAAKALSRKK
jgi:UDP-N-acetylmuramoyl-L-alanyl-D-glutamate--2,6-diaminopimelate ligase